MDAPPASRATAGGLLALVFWSSTIGFSRVLTEALGSMTAAAAIYLTAGVLGCAPLAVSARRRRELAVLPGAYWGWCGGLFAVYTLALYGAVGGARDRAQVVEVGLVNYLWPSLTLVFSVPVLGSRARWTLAPGIAIACAGVVLAVTPEGTAPLAGLAGRVAAAPLPYALALVAAVSWALYNTVGRRVAGGAGGGAVPVFMLVTGALLAASAAASGERGAWSAKAIAPLAYMAVFPTWLAYGLWDVGMRRGHIVMLSSASYLTPVVSTLVSTALLGLSPSARLWLSCLLVMIGAVVCNRAMIRSGP